MRGGDKLLEPVDGVPLLRAQITKASAVSKSVFVALPGPEHPRVAALVGTSATALHIAKANEGMGASLRDGVAQLPDCPAFMLLLADMPALTVADLRAVLNARNAHPHHDIWRGATQSGKTGHPVLFDASVRPHFATLKDDIGGAPLVDPSLWRIHLVPLPGNNARLDLDTPEDWAAWRKRTGR